MDSSECFFFNFSAFLLADTEGVLWVYRKVRNSFALRISLWKNKALIFLSENVIEIAVERNVLKEVLMAEFIIELSFCSRKLSANHYLFLR